MGKKLGEGEKRSAVVLTTLRPSEREQIERRAADAGLTLSSAIRRMILKQLKKEPKERV